MLLTSFAADHPVDTIATHPVNNYAHLFAVGCYRLEQVSRCGGVQLGLAECFVNRTVLQLAPFFPLSFGVLDAKLFAQSSGDDCAYLLFGIGSDRQLHVLRILTDSGDECTPLSVQYVNGISGGENNEQSKVIGVAMDVLPQASAAMPTPTSSSCFTAVWSLSDGTVHHSTQFPAVPLSSRTPTTTWKAHVAEVWTVALDPTTNGQHILTGADDCILKLWDLRCGVSHPAAVNRSHDMGVTVASFDPGNDTLVVTGSYDGVVRVWDRRHFLRPYAVHSTAAKDGIWRIKFDQSIPATETRQILIAATHGGCEVWAADSLWKHVSRVGKHQSHKSMAYGVAPLGVQKTVSRGLTNPQHVYMSGSFYDRHVAIWTV